MSSLGLQPVNSQVRLITGILRSASKQTLAQGVGEELGLVRFIHTLQRPGKLLVINNTLSLSRRAHFARFFDRLYLRRINWSLFRF